MIVMFMSECTGMWHRPIQYRFYERIGKRVLDVLIALLLLVGLSPLMLVIALVSLWVQGRPLIFRQARPGLHEVPFTIYKLRTMRDLKDPRGRCLEDEQRLTRFGAFVRQTSLDELPELVNVLRGEMSLVGPRPLLIQYLPRYNAIQRRRHTVKPGITGWAQIRGRNALTWERKFDLDVWYVDHRSLFLDLKILWLTVGSVVRCAGIRHGSHVTMPEFLGSTQGGTEC